METIYFKGEKMIRISEKYGVNPAVPLCYFCNQEKNELILAGRLEEDKEAPHKAVWDMIPCDKCKEFMKQGIILISVKDGESGKNPYRTGGWVVVKEEAAKRMFGETNRIIETRIGFVEDETWNTIGLPRE